ncbi:MAG: CBS domain-containing protein [Candidatus Micrarchaeia archaeon]
MEFPDLNGIRIRRERLGITQKALAKEAGISQSMLTKIERGLVMPSYGTAIAIFAVLESREHRGEQKAAEVMKSKVILLRPSDTVEKAAELSRRYAVSQFPVVLRKSIVGSVSTSDMLWSRKGDKVESVMSEPFPIVSKGTPVSSVKALLKTAKAVLVMGNGSVLGIITADDLL